MEDTQRQLELEEFIGKAPISLKEQGLSKRSRIVICVETGEEFETVQKAVKAYGKSVSAVLVGKCELAYGYHWVYKDDTEAFNKVKHLFKSNYKHRSQSTKKPVLCIETGELFESKTTAIKKYGSGIIPVLANKPGHKTAYGYRWRYLEEEEFNELYKN